MAYTISDELKELFRTGRRVSKITVYPVSGNSFELDSSNIIASPTVDRTCSTSASLELGSCIASELTFSVLASSVEYKTLLGAELYVQTGVIVPETGNPQYIPLGYFTIDDLPTVGDVISVTALDRMMFFDSVIDMTSFQTWATGKTIQECVQYCCTRVSVALATSISNYPNASFKPDFTVLSEEQDLTYRNLLQWCCELMGKCAYIDAEGLLRIEFPETAIAANSDDVYYDPADGLVTIDSDSQENANEISYDTSTDVLQIKYPSFTTSVSGSLLSYDSNDAVVILASGYAETITEAERYSSVLEHFTVTITGVYYDAEDGTRSVVGTDNYAFDISANPLVPETPSTVLNNLTDVIGIEYTPFTAQTLPYPHLFPMDRIVFQKNGVGHATLLTNVTYTSTGGTALSGLGESEKAKSYARTGAMTEAAKLIMKQQVDKGVNKAVTDAVQAATLNATQMITASTHGQVTTLDTDNDGKPNEFLIMDATNTSDAQNVWRWNLNGLGFSSTGYNGTYGLALTADGKINADAIAAGHVSAQYLDLTGALFVDGTIRCGTGGGKFIVSPTGSVTMADATITGGTLNINVDDLTNDGITLYKMSGQYIIGESKLFYDKLQFSDTTEDTGVETITTEYAHDHFSIHLDDNSEIVAGIDSPDYDAIRIELESYNDPTQSQFVTPCAKLTLYRSYYTQGEEDGEPYWFEHIKEAIVLSGATGNITADGTISAAGFSLGDGSGATANLLYKNQNGGTDQVLRVYDSGSTYGASVVVGGASNTFIGSGEGTRTFADTYVQTNPTTEHMFILSDGSVYIRSGTATYVEAGNEVPSDRVGISISANGNVLPVKAGSPISDTINLGTSTNKFKNVYATTLNGKATDATDSLRSEWAVVAGDTISSTFFGYGYTSGTSGSMYLFLPFSRKVRASAVSINSCSGVYVRGVNGLILNNISAVSSLNLSNIVVSENGFRLLLTGLTTNWVANTPVSIVGTFSFTFANS